MTKPACTKNCECIFHMTGGRHATDCPAYDPGCPTCGSPDPNCTPRRRGVIRLGARTSTTAQLFVRRYSKPSSTPSVQHRRTSSSSGIRSSTALPSSRRSREPSTSVACPRSPRRDPAHRAPDYSACILGQVRQTCLQFVNGFFCSTVFVDQGHEDYLIER